jgi:hypothetical protein
MPSLFTSIWGNTQQSHAIQGAGDDQITGILRALGLVNSATEGANADIQRTTNNANADLTSATEGAVGNVNSAVTNAQNGVNAATQSANEALNPYASAGSTAIQSLIGILSDPSKFAPQTFQFNPNEDPGAVYRQQQQQKAIERSAAARGAVLGGGTLQALAQRSQDLASQEYGASFDRFDKNRTSSLNQLIAQMSGLSGVAGTGLTAATRQGGNTTAAAQYSGDIGVHGAEWTGNAGLNTARYTGDRNINTMNTVTNNTLNAARFNAQGQMGIGDIQAGVRLGRQGQKTGILNSIGRTGDAMLAGGLAGGGGFGDFDWGGAMYGGMGIPRGGNGGRGGYFGGGRYPGVIVN